jgi:tetratricopeptide (TPR) repeat protein
MNIYRTTTVALVMCSWLLLGSPAAAHDGPEHEIEELTARIKAEGESADLLLQRAIEFNVLNKSAEAIKDLERALHFEANSAGILRELSRAYFGAGKTNEAYDTAGRGIKNAEEGAERAALRMVRCEISRAKRDYQKALEDADKAIAEHPETAEWYLTRSALQQQLGLKKERIKGLDDGFKQTGSGLVEGEWIDALIDGGKGETALAKIEAELKDARVQSTWLIRRAKVRLAMKQKEEAKTDLEAALAELNQRIARGTDPLLLADRGQVHELLGNTEDAKKDYESAREKGNRDEWIRERLRKFKEAEDKKKEAEKKKNGDKKETDKDSDKKDDSKDEKPDTDDPKEGKPDDKGEDDK